LGSCLRIFERLFWSLCRVVRFSSCDLDTGSCQKYKVQLDVLCYICSFLLWLYAVWRPEWRFAAWFEMYCKLVPTVSCIVKGGFIEEATGGKLLQQRCDTIRWVVGDRAMDIVRNIRERCCLFGFSSIYSGTSLPLKTEQCQPKNPCRRRKTFSLRLPVRVTFRDADSEPSRMP
jgi:hypothetical protein